MRMVLRLLIGATILVSATAPVLAASLQSGFHGGPSSGGPSVSGPNVSGPSISFQPMRSGSAVSGAGQGGVAPLARKMTPKGCYRNCMRGGMREDFCTLSCY